MSTQRNIDPDYGDKHGNLMGVIVCVASTPAHRTS